MSAKEHSHADRPLLGSVCGVFAGAIVGSRAAQGVCGWANEHAHLSGLASSHAEAVTHMLESAGAIGGGVVGYLIAADKPLDAVFLAAATAATLSHAHGEQAGISSDADADVLSSPGGLHAGNHAPTGPTDALPEDGSAAMHETSIHVLV
jgi:hypothetical protein